MRAALTTTALTAIILAACTPVASPSPTAAPASPVPTTAPAKQPSQAAATKAPTQPATKPSPSQASAPAASPAAKSGFDEQAVADFYKGKTVKIIVGFTPGGGFDTYARTISRHIGKYIPGNPSVIVENMPGAGSLLAANHVFNIAPKDGTVIASVHGFSFLQDLFDGDGVDFEGDKWEYIGVPGQSTYLCFATEASGIKSLKDVMKPNGQQLILGGDAPGSSTDSAAAILEEALNLNIKLVPGYGGTSKIRLAMERGEVDGVCGWSWESARTTNLEDVQSGQMIPLVQITDKPIEDLPGTQNVPLAKDLAATDEARQMIRLGIENPGKMSRPYLLPPGTPKDRVVALRQALSKTLKDPELLVDAEKAKIDVVEISGEQLEQLVKEMFSMPASTKDKLKPLLAP